MITIKGILEKLTYQNQENHYTIAKLRIAKISEPVTIVGHLAGVGEGESLEVFGRWGSHPKYGDQFKIEGYTVVLPATVSGIRKYLGSGMIKGIGKSLADKIVDHFEETTLDIIENEPEKLEKIHGIGTAKKKLIEQAWNKHHAVRRVIQFLQENGVSVHHAAAILQTYGSRALDILQHNPYVIAKDIPEIGFTTADRIAMKSGGKKEDENRLQACLIYCLLSLEQDGHVYGIKQDVFKTCSRLSGVEPELFEQALVSLKALDEVKTETSKENTNIYLSRLFRAESKIASRIKAILSMPRTPLHLSKDQILETVLTKLAVKLSKEQLNVVY
ncbi:MAG: ATP-dependent RecD-like DNA helicase, partial [Proteobacteria bacterium]|nr:ATP-dependent RecD-like DNA helicase [Pseudomonadota bacterium]